MKLNHLLLALLCTATVFSQCKTTKYTPDNLPDEYLRFGNGGGFTGIETTYTLLENGQLFKSVSRQSETQELATCKRKKVKRLFERAETLDLANLKFMYPGNIYQFVEILDDGAMNRIVWGEKDNPVDENIKSLHEELMQLIVENH
ncbi:MAG: hypothetical protein H6574_20260 [Lewinellaceae bacterium]|nr:hypothetical protein [Saprospiraceae bacterium]MCB9333399.1 hypothetical protein [Lewinellaceae bacterium]